LKQKGRPELDRRDAFGAKGLDGLIGGIGVPNANCKVHYILL
jgi:hypothetical protein